MTLASDTFDLVLSALVAFGMLAALTFATVQTGHAPPPGRGLRARFLAFDDRLASLGVPPLTPWWREGIGEWLDAYEAGGVLQLFACVGRGAAKSTALYKLALFFALFGDVAVPPGERHYAIVLAFEGRGSEGDRHHLALVQLARGVAHRVSGDVVDLGSLPRGLRVVAASVAATSGWRAFFVGKDERGKFEGSGVDEFDATRSTRPRPR